MVATYSVLSLLLIFALSLLAIRVGSVALRMTGLSPDVASFQSTSAFTGAGFTTDESELIVSTPERRRIVKSLIRLGNVGIVSAIASLVLSFSGVAGGNVLRFGYIVGGSVLIVLVARSRWLNRIVTPIIERSLSRTTALEIRDYTEVLGLESGYRVAEIDVDPGDWLADATPTEIDLDDEGVVLLGIRQADGTYVGAPGPDTEIHPGDTLVLYGRAHRLQELSRRESDDVQAHDDAVEEYEVLLEKQGSRIERPT